MNNENKGIKRVLVIRAGRLGDTVWATTVIEPIRAFFGEHVRIDIIVMQGMGTLFEHDPRIETIYEIDHRSIPLLLSPTKMAVLLKSLHNPYDLVLNLEMGSHFASLMRHIRATRKISATPVPTEHLLEYRHMVDSVRYTLAQVIPASFCQEAAPSLRFSENIDIAGLLGTTDDYLCLHPGNSMLARGKPALRSWPESHWCELAEQIARHHPALQIVLIGEKSEQALSLSIAARLPKVINLVGRTSLQQLMAVLARTKALVTTDTGPAHVAAALAAPVIAVFGPSEAHGTGPFPSAEGWAVSIMKDVGCNPCVNTDRAKTCTDNKCMHVITPSDVLKLIDEALLKQPVPPVIQLDNNRVEDSPQVS
jgi:heptosyltransferase-2